MFAFQSSPEMTRGDVETMEWYLRSRRESWELAWQCQHASLAKQKQRCQFNADLHQIQIQLDDLSRQLSAMKGQYGSSLAMSKVTSQAFVQFGCQSTQAFVQCGPLSREEKGFFDDCDGIHGCCHGVYYGIATCCSFAHLRWTDPPRQK